MAKKLPQSNGKSAARKAFDKASSTYKKVERYGTEQLMEHAEKLGRKVNENIYPELTAEEHRIALIETCIKTDEIFSDNITDKPEAKTTQLQNYMFYNQLYFLAIAQMTQSGANGNMLEGLVGGLSMIAGAAIMNEDFRKNLKEHVEDALIKYVEPFKDSQPKLWQELSARVESHPGCESPEGIAIKLLRYQHQAAEAVSKGASTKEMNELLLKKTAELKGEADAANIPWSQVIQMRTALTNSLDTKEKDREAAYGKGWKNQVKMELNSKREGLGKTVGIDKLSHAETKDWEAPIDTISVAKRLVSYQKQLQEAVEALHNSEEGFEMPPKFAHLKGKKEHELFESALSEVVKLKAYAEKTLDLDWSEITAEYDNLNKERYDIPSSMKRMYEGRPSQTDVIRLDGKMPTETEYESAKEAIRRHNNFMHYELPVDADSAGRCLKKYQQDAFENVRDISERHNYGRKAMDSGSAYALADKLCQNVQVASKALGFDWTDTVTAYRKDVMKTVRKREDLSVIWRELSEGSVVTNIPENTTVYVLDENGKSQKVVKPLSKSEQIPAWDGAVFDASGNKLNATTLFQVRNPYTSDEATLAFTALMNERNAAELEKKELLSQSGGKETPSILTVQQRLSDIDDRFSKMNRALISDRYTPNDILQIKQDAMAAYDEQIKQFTEMYEEKHGIRLDEGLMRNNEKKDDSASYGPSM